MKRILLVILALAMMINFTGCIKKKELSVEEKKQKVMAHLKDKYKEEFVLESVSLDDNWSYPYDRFFLHPSNSREGEDTFVVRGYLDDDGSYGISDGYFGVLIRDEYEAVMSGFVRECYKDFKLSTSFSQDSSVFSDRLNKDVGISEIYSHDELFDSYTLLLVSQSDALKVDENLRKIADSMVKSKLVGEVRLLAVYDDKYEQLQGHINWDEIWRHLDKYSQNPHGTIIDISPDLKIEEVTK